MNLAEFLKNSKSLADHVFLKDGANVRGVYGGNTCLCH